MKPLRFSSEAIHESADAAAWYESTQAGLAARFLDDLHRITQAIEARPLSFPRIDHPAEDLQLRRAILLHFPYALVFVELTDEIRVLALAHLKRRPRYWLNRLHPSP